MKSTQTQNDEHKMNTILAVSLHSVCQCYVLLYKVDDI